MTPSLPTLSMAFAISSPISLSPFAEIVPTYNCIIRLVANKDAITFYTEATSTQRQYFIHFPFTSLVAHWADLILTVGSNFSINFI